MKKIDDVILNKVGVIERCLNRIYANYQGELRLDDYDQQDILILNLQRASQAAIDIAMHVCTSRKFGVPQTSSAAFEMLAIGQLVSRSVVDQMKLMTGFRNIAVHDYQDLSLDILKNVLDRHLGDFDAFKEEVVALA